MSPIGRIFLVICFALAAMFLGASAGFLGKSDSYRFRYEESERSKTADVAALEEQKKELEAGVAQAKRLKAEAEDARRDLEVKRDSLTLEIAGLTDEKAQLTTAVTAIDSRLSNMNTVIEETSSRADTAAQSQIEAVQVAADAKAARAVAEAAQAAAEDKVNMLEDNVAMLEERLATATNRIQSLDTVLATAERTHNFTRTELGEAAPPIDGAVVAVSNDDGMILVHLNKGQVDGVRQGFKFDIYSTSSNEYKGQAEVKIVHPNRATAIVTLKREGTSMMQGDRASTLISSL